jgi:hypothetical protein
MTLPTVTRKRFICVVVMMTAILTLAGNICVLPSAAAAPFAPSAVHHRSVASGSDSTDAGDLAHAALCAGIASTAGVALDRAFRHRGAVSPGTADSVLHPVRAALTSVVAPIPPRGEGPPLFLRHATF